jgi:preprotein translocase subunit SecB
MKNSPLQLERHYVTAIHLDAHTGAQVQDAVELNIDSKVALATHKGDPRRWRVELTVSFQCPDEANSPYKGSISFTGHFSVAASYAAEKVQMLVETNGPSVLYGAVREMLANLTARGPWPMVMLPTQSFYRNQPRPAATEPQSEPAALEKSST